MLVFALIVCLLPMAIARMIQRPMPRGHHHRVAQLVKPPAVVNPSNNSSNSTACTFSDVDALAAGKAGCSCIVLNNLVVPAGTTLDLSDLNSQEVIFQGTTTFGYADWAGPMIQIIGSKVTVTGAPGHVIDFEGERWWDGKGLAGGVKKPKGIVLTINGGDVNDLNLRSTPLNGGCTAGLSEIHC